tara:strand:+ start:661 stop:1560 length:900 start_codon:yes stop_codon:yes gene_type:complete
LNFKQLEAFVQVARSGTVSAAAARLNTTQPAISMRLKDLEHSFRSNLFDRSARKIRLTPVGHELLEYAERIQLLAEEALTKFGSEKVMTGHIRLGVTETVALTWLPKFVSSINHRFPEVGLELDVDLTEGIWNRLNRGDLEIALLPGPVGGPNLRSQSLGRIRYDWMASPSLNIPDHLISPKTLSLWPILTFGNDSNLHDVIEEWFQEHGVRPRRVDICNSLSVVASLATAGLGIALLPPSIFDDTSKLKLLETEPKLPDLEFVAVYSRRTESPLVRSIVEMAIELSNFKLDPSNSLKD